MLVVSDCLFFSNSHYSGVWRKQKMPNNFLEFVLVREHSGEFYFLNFHIFVVSIFFKLYLETFVVSKFSSVVFFCF